MAEVRFDMPDEILQVIDGYCNASGKCRTEVIREQMSHWASAKVHESILICRTTRINPLDADAGWSAPPGK